LSSPAPYLSFHIGTRIGRFSLEIKPRGTPSAEQPTGPPTSTTDPAPPRIIPIHPQSQSRFFNLPVELRLQIYERILTLPPSQASYTRLLHNPSRSQYPPHSVLALLAVCRRTHHEAEALFFRLNRLRLLQPSLFIHSVSPRRREGLTHLAVCVASAAELLTEMQRLRAFPNLETLVVERLLSIRYIEPRSWAVLTPNLVAEVRALPRLRSLRIVTPRDDEITEVERARLRKLEIHDGLIVAAVGGGGGGTT
jgi:hypothetical protein